MPAPQAKRQSDLTEALKIMAGEVGDHPLWAVYWRVQDEPKLSTLLPTTLPELEEQGSVRRESMFGGIDNWHLTEEGWVRGMELNGTLTDPVFRERVYQLVAHLKDQIDREDPDDVLLDTQEIAHSTGLPDGWVQNVVKSDLLPQLIPDKKMNAWYDQRQHLIRVPPTFGMQVP